MQESATTVPPPMDRVVVSDAVRVQILATEHWSLLATRGSTWNEMFARAGMYLTVLSAATVALALVAQADDFGETFRLFALLILPVVLLLGVSAQIRLGDALGEDAWLVTGMNRLRHAYLELAPELEPYFITGHYDDPAGVMRTYGPAARITPGRVLSGVPVLVGVINGVVTGVLAALVADVLDAGDRLGVAVGIVACLAYLIGFALTPLRQIARLQKEMVPRFPTSID